MEGRVVFSIADSYAQVLIIFAWANQNLNVQMVPKARLDLHNGLSSVCTHKYVNSYVYTMHYYCCYFSSAAAMKL